MAVILPSVYQDGTATVENEGLIVTGQSTLWGTPEGTGNSILPGDFFGVHEGFAVRIASVDSNTQLTLANPWPGPDQTAAHYEIMLQSDNARMTESTRQILQKLMNGNIDAFAGLVGTPDSIPMFTGPGAMTLVNRADLVSGLNFDVEVDTLPERDAYDNQAAGFVVLVADVGDGRAAIFYKRTNAVADWSDPAYVTGPAGLNWRGDWNNATAYAEDDAVFYNSASWIALRANTNVAPVSGADWGMLAARGATGPIGMTSKGTYDAGTAYLATESVLYNGSTWVARQNVAAGNPPPSTGTQDANWQLVAAAGINGTGTGDVVGPNAAVTGRVATFNGTTGKLIADGGKLAADLVVGPASSVDGALSAFSGAGGKTLKAVTAAQAKTWLATTAVDVSFDNSTANIPGSPTTVQAALNAFAAGAAGGKNDALFAIEIADLKGVKMGMVGGVADSFDDTTGIVTSGIGGVDGYTALMLHMDGTNGSTTFTDDSFSARVVTPTSVTISTAQSVFGGASGLFGGAGSLSVPDAPVFNMGTNPFTIEARVRVSDLTGGSAIASKQTTSSSNCWRWFIAADGRIYFQIYVSNVAQLQFNTANPVITANTWYHVALVRNGNTFITFVNGVVVDTTTSSVSVPTFTEALRIGQNPTDGPQYFKGNIDEFRFSTVARWTAAFTPPASAYNVPGGNDANTLLLLHADGANGSQAFVDSSPFGRTVTPSSSPQTTISTAQSVFGGASALFPSGGGSLAIPDSDDWAYGSSNFTIEARARITDLSITRAIVTQVSDANNMFRLLVLSTGAVFFEQWTSGATAVTMTSATGLVTVNNWYHIALVRNGTAWAIYLNGAPVASVTSSATIPNLTGPLIIGNVLAGSSYPMIGNIDEVRVSNVARYASAFTPYNVAFFADQSASINFVYDATNDWFSPSFASAAGGTYGPGGGGGGAAFNNNTGANSGNGKTPLGYGGGAGGAAGGQSGAGTGAAGSPGLVLIRYTTTGGTPFIIPLTSGTSWTVPSDWNSANNSVHVIGAGGGSGSGYTSGASANRNAGGGGGGGAYSAVQNITLTPGSAVSYQIGTSAANTAGGDTWFNGANLAASTVGAKGGGAGSNGTAGGSGAGGTGGQSSAGIGTTKNSGGNGATPAQADGAGGGGGGGAAGPNGVGGNGSSATGANGGGGGGANGGSAGSGNVGGNGRGGSGGGALTNPGGDATAGSGAGGGGALSSTSVNLSVANLTGGAGARDDVWEVVAVYNNMTLSSINYAATAVPNTGRIALQLADSLSLTPGTDFSVEISRDGGNTWSLVTMALTMPLFGGVKMYEGTVSLSGQPSGSLMAWRFKTLTNKNIIASGVVLQQS